MNSGLRFLGASLAVGTLLLGAAAAPQAHAQVDEIKYAYSVSSPSLITESLFIAEKMGYLDRESIKVNVTWLQGDALALKAVLSNDVDVAWVGTTAAIQAISRGARIRILYGPVPKSSNVILGQKDVAGVAGLKGRSVAVSTVGAISYHIPRIIMKRSGLDPDLASYVAIGSPSSRLQALVGKKVDAGMVDLIQAQDAADRYPFLHAIASVAETIPDLHFISVIASERAIETKGDALRRLMRAEVAGLKYLVEHPAEAAAASMSRMGAKDPKNVTASFETAAKLKIYGTDGGLDPEVLTKTVQLMIEMGDLKQAVPLEALVDTKVSGMKLR